MNTLQQLGIKKNWLYEIIISTYGPTTSHAAPFGIKSSDLEYITIEMYKGSKTLENVLANGEFVLNLVDNLTFFYQALYAGEKINFSPSQKINTPVMADSPSSIEMLVKTAVTEKQRVIIKAEAVHIRNPKKIKLINRAKGLFMESLILSTRSLFLPKIEFDKSMQENYRVIKKVSPGSKYEAMMKNLLNHQIK